MAISQKERMIPLRFLVLPKKVLGHLKGQNLESGFSIALLKTPIPPSLLL